MSYNSDDMSILLTFVTFLIFIKLLVVAAMRPKHSEFSAYELERRIELGDRNAKKMLMRDNALYDIISLQKICISTLLVVLTVMSIVSFGWLLGILLTLFVALEYGTIARIGFIKGLSQKIYNCFEGKILIAIEKIPYLFKIFRSESVDNDSAILINSRQELQHIVDNSVGILTSNEKNMIVSNLSFGDKLVDSVMTPKSMVDYVKNTEFLGPLTLDDLHKTGHSRLPVIKNDIDHVIGILNLKNLLSLDEKHSKTAEKAMDSKVYYIRHDQTLSHALAAFLRVNHHLFIVINEFRETVGLLTLEDIIEALIGHKIVDEFDAHDNLRAVASRNIRKI